MDKQSVKRLTIRSHEAPDLLEDFAFKRTHWTFFSTVKYGRNQGLSLRLSAWAEKRELEPLLKFSPLSL
jgi:hypothetical protein